MLGMELLTHNVFVSNTLLLLVCKKNFPEKSERFKDKHIVSWQRGTF